MMTFQPLFIPLYFDETEADLWLALQQIEPEKRSSFVKETLREVLLGTDTEESFRHPLQVTEDMAEIRDDSDYHQEAQAEDVHKFKGEGIETFFLDDLFAQTHAPHLEEEPRILTDHEKAMSTPNQSTGFDYLMKHIIGSEEDEAVLMVLKGR